MLDPARYFDHAASTPLAPEVRAEMEPFLAFPANAHSLHAFGRRAEDAVERARQRVAEAIGAEAPEQVIFTSGATEACNTVIKSHAGGWISPFEHAAVREPALLNGYQVLENDGFALTPPGEQTSKGPHLMAVMAVNNEVGAVLRPLPSSLLFVDATQALGKAEIDLEGVDYAAFSGHKLYGPQGAGALYSADGTIDPLLEGGDHEDGRRAGTLNVAGIVGFGAACALVTDRRQEDWQHAVILRELLMEELQPLGDRVRVNGGDDAVPHILSLSFDGIEGETLVIEADGAGFAISAGAACSSRSTEPSHVLTALEIPEQWRRGTIRVSFGRANTRETTSVLGKTLVRSVQNLRTIA